jgi:2-polyprenyl-3-methyl-5-hydroxy-6-metoxy-1,4-benzoquinol methylase
MRVGDVVRLDREPRLLEDLPAYLSEQVSGRSVLDIGVAGGIEHYLPDHVDQWLHARIKHAATDVLAIDIDQQGISHAARHGWAIHHADCQIADLGRTFDVAVMVEVIEHVESPARAIANTLKHLVPGGRLYLTTPNPTFFGDIIRAFRGRSMSVYWDHQALFAPEHVQALCDRHGFVLSEVRMFCQRDQRSCINRFKSSLIERIGRINPRLNTSWLGVIQAKQH